MTDQDRIRACLYALEDAQAAVNEAARHLSTVPGFSPEWSSLSAVHDAVRGAWHRVDGKRAEIRRQTQRPRAARHPARI